jgi:hypothetical protein
LFHNIIGVGLNFITLRNVGSGMTLSESFFCPEAANTRDKMRVASNIVFLLIYS